MLCQTVSIDSKAPNGLYLVEDDEVTAQLTPPRCQVGKAQSQSQSNAPPLTATKLSDGPLLQSTFALHMHTLHRPAAQPFVSPATTLALQNCLFTVSLVATLALNMYVRC